MFRQSLFAATRSDLGSQVKGRIARRSEVLSAMAADGVGEDVERVFIEGKRPDSEALAPFWGRSEFIPGVGDVREVARMGESAKKFGCLGQILRRFRLRLA